MFIPSNLIPPVLPASPELDASPVHAPPAAGASATPAAASLAAHARPPAAPPARRPPLQKLLYESLAYVRGQTAEGKNKPAAASMGDLPPELLLAIADQATPQSVAHLSGTNRRFRHTLEEKSKLASIVGNAAKLRDADHFTALLDGTAKAENQVRHSVLDLAPQDQAQALEALASNLINMSRSPHDQIYSIENFNAFMAQYRGPSTPLLKELENVAIKTLEDPRSTPQDIDWHFQVRQQSHFPEILARTKGGEPLDGLLREFAITTVSAKRFLAEQASK